MDESRGLSTLSLCFFFSQNILSVRISRLQVNLERGINTQYPIAVLLFLNTFVM